MGTSVDDQIMAQASKLLLILMLLAFDSRGGQGAEIQNLRLKVDLSSEKPPILGGDPTGDNHGTGGTGSSSDPPPPSNPKCQPPIRRWKKSIGRGWKCVKCPGQKQWVYSAGKWKCQNPQFF